MVEAMGDEGEEALPTEEAPSSNDIDADTGAQSTSPSSSNALATAEMNFTEEVPSGNDTDADTGAQSTSPSPSNALATAEMNDTAVRAVDDDQADPECAVIEAYRSAAEVEISCTDVAMDEVGRCSYNSHSPPSQPASQERNVEETDDRNPANSQLSESDNTSSAIQVVEEQDGQAISADHVNESGYQEATLVLEPSKSSSTTRGLFSVHEIVMASDRGILYEAKVLQCKYVDSSWQYFIHFNGWARRHDTWIEEAHICLASDTERVEAIREQMKAEMKIAATQTKTRVARKASYRDGNSSHGDLNPNAEGDGDSTLVSIDNSRKKRALEPQVSKQSHLL